MKNLFLRKTHLFFFLIFTLAFIYGEAQTVPPNDNCANAASITCGPIKVGSTTYATIDTAPVCAPGLAITAPGVWYKFVGTGNYVTATTCLNGTNYNTMLLIYSGTCGNLTCVTGNDDACGWGPSTAYFNSVLGTDYYILVTGYGTNTGVYRLKLTCTAACIPPANDSCSTAQLLSVAADTSLFSPTTGTNACATVDLNNTTCNPTMSTMDVWYKFNSGTDTSMVMKFNPLTGMYFSYAVYANCGGPSLFCGSTLTGLNVIHNLMPATDYWVQIFNEGGANAGTFELGFARRPPPPANDSCVNAIAVTCGSSTYGGTLFATLDTTTAPACSDALTLSASGVWYSFVGTGDLITFSTCNNYTTYDTKLIIYSGSCGGFVCEAGNEDVGNGPFYGSGKSTAYLNSVLGTTYYVYVSGYLTSVGLFQLDVMCDPACSPPANDDCANATALTLSNDTTSCTATIGTNTCAHIPLAHPPCNPYSLTQDVWYSFNSGSNTSVVVDFDTITGNNFNYALYVNCLDTSVGCDMLKPGINLLTSLTPNTNYWLQIYNYGGIDTGAFSICLSNGPATPPNDTCDDVSPVNIVNGAPAVTLTGTTWGGSANGIEVGVFGPTVWEAFTLTDPCNDVVIDFCGSTPGVQSYSFWPYLFTDCFTFSQASMNGAQLDGFTCSDGNPTAKFFSVPAGTYYYPINATNYNVLGPYTLHIKSTACAVGMEDEKSAKTFLLYPNPASTTLNISSNTTEPATLLIYNEMGQLFIQQQLQSSIDISTLSDGFYFARIQGKDFVSTQRFIIAK